MKKIITLVIMVGFATVLGAQSLADLARNEKERRKSLGGRRAPVVTNQDLLRVRKKPALELTVPEKEAEEYVEGPASEVPVPRTPAAARPVAAKAAPQPEGPPLETQLKAAEELAGLLETKIAKLRQDYSSQESMVPNYIIEQQLTETLERFQKAQAEAARLRTEIARKGPDGKREPGRSSP